MNRTSAQQTIEQTVIDGIITRLRQQSFKSWASLNYEIQDGGRSVLFMVDLKSTPASGNAEGREFARETIEGRIPPREDGIYSWMITFKFNSEVVDAVFAGAV